MFAESISVHLITTECRKRPIDEQTVVDLQRSIEQQGLLQNIGVKQIADGYRLVFGAHRLEAIKALGWESIQARVFSAETSDDECLLAELQENNARKELAGAERKAFAAEVGRLLAKLRENCKTPDDCSLQDGWLIQLAGNSAISQRAAYNWWSAFCRETGLSITPRQASDEHRNAFFAWLDAQKQAEEAEKARRQAEVRAEKERRDREAYEQRVQAEKRDFLRYIDDTVKDWGPAMVKGWITEWLDSHE